MEVSMKLDKVEEHLLDMLRPINDNQNIKRYIRYLSNTPLENTPEQPDIEDSLIYDNILITPYSEKVLTESKVLLFFNPINGNLEDESVGEEIYSLDIIIPITYWILQGQGKLRAFRIGSEIAKIIDGKEITGVGKTKLKSYKCYKLNDTYAGMTLFIKVNTSTLKAVR
jgi:hypothetical protein